MATDRLCGRTVRVIIALLSILLTTLASAAAPSFSERAYREARALMDTDDLASALKKADAALGQLKGANDEWTWALRILRGEALMRQGLKSDALLIVKPELPPHLRTREVAIRRLFALGVAEFPDKEAARPFFEQALKIAIAHQPRLIAAAHLALGNILPFAEAEPHLESALELARRQGNQVAVANASNALSRVNTDRQFYAAGVDFGEEAVAQYKKLGVQGRLTTACGNLGWAYMELGDYESAAELFACAVAAAKKNEAINEQVRYLNQLGNVELAARRYEQAAQYYRQALDLAREIDSDVSLTLTNLARVAVETGRYPDAKRFNTEALDRKRKLDDTDEIHRSLIIEARTAMLTGDPAFAEKTLKGVVAKATRTSTKWEAQAWLATLYARLQRNAEADAQFREALNTAGETRKSITASELRLSFFNLADDVFDRYVDFLVRSGRVDDALAVTEKMRAEALEEGVVAEKVDARQIARQSGATILSYWLGRDRSYVFVITPSNVVVHDLRAPDTTIEKAVDRYQRELAGARGTLQLSGAKGEELYRMLVTPVGATARGTRIAVIADGRLHALNFETLVVPSPQRYWIEDVIVTNAGSLRLLARKTATREAKASMLLIGNAPSPGFAALPRAGEEITSIARHFDRRTILAGSNATPAAYRHATPATFDYIHFVAHGVPTRKRPLDSAVILARGEKLFARDIVAQPLHARLVTISSCHGAGTRTYSGEGLVGLAWAFLKAGADQVIAALWEVNDSATPELMDRMYARIRAGADPAVALRDAKLTLVRGKGSYKKPMYWAPFVLYSGS